MPQGLRVGVLAPFVGGDHFGAIIDGVSAAVAADQGSIIAVQTLNPGTRSADHSGTPALRHPIAWKHFDAALVLGRAMGAEDVRRLQRAGKPVVTIGHVFPGVECPRVGPDNRGGVRQAVRHLAEHGHERIAFAGFGEQHDIRERRTGYVETLGELGLTAGPELLFNSPDNHESGGRAIGRHLLRLAERDGRLPATAIVVGTDRNAIGLFEVLSGAGISVPEDLAVVAFDDIIESQLLRPSLSSVRQPLDEIGRIAYERLKALASDECPPDDVSCVPMALITRESCGCPAVDPRQAAAPEAGPGARRRDWFRNTMQLQQAVNTQYELGVDLLSSHQRDPRAMGWLARTSASAGYLGLWPVQPPARPEEGASLPAAVPEGAEAALRRALADPRAVPDPRVAPVAPRPDGTLPDRPLEIVGGHPSPGRLPEGEVMMPVSAFPPAALLAEADPAAGRIVRVVPVRGDSGDWGVLALVDETQSLTPPGRELVNNAASLLAVALDHEKVLRSLQEQKERLHRAALYDPLTGLPNRALLLDRLRQSAARAARRPDRQFALMFLDLNGFKGINDSLGHAAGDRLLVEVARRLTTLLRRTDTAARMGGDEFVVLLDGLRRPEEATLAADRLRTRLTAPIDLGGSTVTVGVSIGVSRSDEGSLDVDELLRRADSAMYRAKVASRGGAASAG